MISENRWITAASGVKMPPLIYGTAWKKERTEDLVMQAITTGFRGVDTACQPKHYDESGVGKALTRLNSRGIKREDLFLQTKFTPLSGQDPDNVPYDRNSPVALQVAQSFRSSQENLQTEYVDSLILHSPMATYDLTMIAWRAMEEIQKAGGVRQLGISNCYHLELMMALYADAEVKPAVIQNRFYRQTGYDAGLRRWCVDHGVIYQSFWTLTANPHLLASEEVRRMARKYDKTEAQIFFRYLSQSKIVPLTGTTSEQHMKDDLGIFDFALSSAELEAIRSLLV